MSVYKRLPQFLEQKSQGAGSVRVKFSEIEDFLDYKLPASKRYAAWWSNNPTNSVMTKVWLKAGWRTEKVDLDGEELTFVRDPNAKVALAEDVVGEDGNVLDLTELDAVAFKVLGVLAKRAGHSIDREALKLLNEALGA